MRQTSTIEDNDAPRRTEARSQTIVDDDRDRWPFDGEYCADELASYRVRLRSVFRRLR